MLGVFYTPVSHGSPGVTPWQTEPVYDIMGNKAITLPKQWPLARPQLATRQARLERSELRLGFAWALYRESNTPKDFQCFRHARGVATLREGIAMCAPRQLLTQCAQHVVEQPSTSLPHAADV